MLTRRSTLLASLSVLAMTLSLSARQVAADAPSPAPPTNLAMRSPSGATLPEGAWTASGKIAVRFSVTVGNTPLTPEVEIRPASVALTGKPNFSGPSLSSSGVAQVWISGLSSLHRYHWQARVDDGNGNVSPWVSAGSGSFDIGVDMSAPSRPTISSQTDPDQNRWYNNRTVSLQFKSSSYSGIAGYTYTFLRTPHVIPAGPITPSGAATVSNLSDGAWWVAVRAVSNAGIWSPTATYRILLDRQPPVVTWQSPGSITFNPNAGPLTVSFSVDKDSTIQAQLWRVGARSPVSVWGGPVKANKTMTITLNGKDPKGKLLPRGYYYFSFTATDHANNVWHHNLGGIRLQPETAVTTPAGVPVFPNGGKLIIVSLRQQTLYAYDGTHLVLQTYVTTGNPNLPTPPGNYTVMARYHPYEFISPWPQGSPYYYPPSWSNYALLFRDGGYFLHDAPWRSAFGPGTNGAGQPGTNYGGTHGCINIPPSPMLFLWNWTPVGTPVDVVP